MDQLSKHSIDEANRDRNERSTYKNAHGAKGESMDICPLTAETMYISAPEGGFGALEIDFSWDHGAHNKGLFGAIKNALGHGNVDLDLGCLYELQNGKTGCLQAFGDLYGSFEKEPFIQHSGDERSGKAQGADESLSINGGRWNDIKRVLVYAYIYKGALDWLSIKPEVLLHGAGDADIRMVLEEDEDHLPICALLILENENGRIAVTRRGEYFHGHPEMDRAYGFGLNWQEGAKQ